MYSASIKRNSIEQLQKLLPKSEATLHKALTRLKRNMGQSLSKGDWQAYSSMGFSTDNCPAALLRASTACLEQLALASESATRQLFPPPWQDPLKQLFWSLSHFNQTADQADDSYRVLAQTNKRGKLFSLELYCADPASRILKRLQAHHGTAMLSATLSPLTFYARCLGIHQHYGTVDLASPFDQSKLKVINCNWVDTRLRQRDQSLESVCELINRCWQAKPGRYLVFFPSYRYLTDCAEALQRHFPDLSLLTQKVNMTGEQRDQWLQGFISAEQGQLGFAILGGIFAEGIDLPGDQLDGAIIVGLGLASPDLHQAVVEQHFDRQGLAGFDFSYRLPALCRVAQAGGRVIRSDKDRGVIILADYRYKEARNTELLPAHWQLHQCANIDQMEQGLLSFWRQSADNTPMEND
jgi:Rad3-related DNA helicase